jgi:hypothetical protein
MNTNALWERIRFFILTGLIILSLVQSGILWFSQNRGFPFYFFTGINASDMFFGNNITADSKTYFSPQRIILSPGSGEFKRIVPPNDSRFDEIWQEVKEKYLRRIFSNEIKPTNTKAFNSVEWGSLMSKSPITIELSSNYPIEIISWFLKNTTNIHPNGPNMIEKMIIVPNDYEYGNQDVFFITDGIKIYQYLLNNTIDGFVSTETVQQIIQENEDKEKIRFISTFDQLRNQSLFDMDIILEYNSKHSRLFYPIIRNLPNIALKDSYTINQLDTMSELILGKENDNYVIPTEKNGVAIFRRPGSGIYSVYPNGILEYKQLSSTEAVKKGGVDEVFEKVLTFIEETNKRANLTTGVNIALKEIEYYSQGDYGFYFKYLINTKDDAGNYEINFKNEDENAAIYIRADAKRITECRWIMGSYDVEKNGDNYITDFDKLIENTYETWDLNRKYIHIANLGIYYIEMDPKKGNETINPQWLITSDNDKIYNVMLPKD